MNTKRDALITAISYADIFDYPLTEKELNIWLPFRTGLKRSHLAVLQGETLRELIHCFRTNDDTYYSLRSTRQLIITRNKRLSSSQKKWNRARWVAVLLRCIPTITLVGATGGLARSNANEEDDIDLLILCTAKTLWMTRGASTMLLDMFGLRRHPKDRRVQNLVCLNMFMTEDGFALPAQERDLFSAHEVLLMTRLWDRGGAYQKFLLANHWVKKFLPNAWKYRNQESGIRNYENRQNNVESIFSFILHTSYFILRLLEPFVKTLQLKYMSKRRSTEVVTDTVIRFHPRDARGWIKKKLGNRLAHFNIPLDKIFYAR